MTLLRIITQVRRFFAFYYSAYFSKCAYPGLFLHIFFAACLWVPLNLPAPVAAASPAQMEIRGFIESENFINTYTEQEFKDAVKKNELHTRLEVKYGKDDLYFFTRTDLYLLPNLFDKDDPHDYRYADEQTVARNLRFSDERYDWAFNELFVNYMMPPLRLRLGNQIFHWGTADVFNPTAYFNPNDIREFLFHDDDEFKQGIPAFSAMYLSNRFTTEFVFSFVHVPMQFAAEGNFWSIDMDRSLYTVSVKEPEGMDTTIDHSGVGARISTNLLDADISFSAYHGPDRDSVLRPTAIEYPPNQPLQLDVEQYYDMITMAGVDFSKAMGDFVFQFECAYSPDKPNIVMQDLSSPAAVRLPFDVRTSDYISYAAGFNYYIPLSDFFENHSGEAIFILDWFEAHYFDDALAEPSLSDILTLRFQDTYFDGHITIKLTAMFETRHGGSIYWPKLKYDFLNGWTAELGYAAIDGNLDGQSIEPLFYHFRDNDIAMLKVRYEF
jgi:hypothetical protein